MNLDDLSIIGNQLQSKSKSESKKCKIKSSENEVDSKRKKSKIRTSENEVRNQECQSKKSKKRTSEKEEQSKRKLVIIDDSFPPKVSKDIQDLLEFRLQLLSKYPIFLNGGESMVIETNCYIQENAKACMYIKSNPNIPLLCEERYVNCENQNLSLIVFNLTNNVIQIPTNACIAYLIISR